MQSARLNIEPLRVEHADETWPHLQDGRLWTHFPHLQPKSLEQLRATYEHRIRRASERERVRWENWICRERASGRVAGDLQTTIFLHDDMALIAYMVYPPYQRRGFAREAVGELLRHLREAHGIHRARAEIGIANAASIALVESLGFRQVAEEGHEYVYELAL